MSDADAFALFREGALWGIPIGVLLTLCTQEVVRGARQWWRQVQYRRAQLRRCSLTWECVDDDGHEGACVNLKECD